MAAEQAEVLKPLASDASAAVTRDDNQGLDQAAPAAAGDVVTVNPAVTHQTMRGWEVTAQADHYRSDYFAFQNAALDKVVEAGINRVRLEVRSGSENTVDSFGAWQAAGYPSSGTAYQEWRTRRYETINDNGDPNSAAGGRFYWSELDSTVDRIVNPLRTRMAAKGESLYVNLTYVAFYGAVTTGASNVHQTPAEYAEFMLEVFRHLQQKYGWTPNAVNLVLEPDNTNNWGGALLGQTAVAVGTRLAAAGFTPQLIAPSTTNMTTAPLWFDQMMAVPNVSTYLKELAYHRYSNVSTASLQSIAAKSQAAGIGSSMLEWWDPANNFTVLHEDLTTGRNSAWQQATIVDLSSAVGLGIAYINPATPTAATFTNPTKFTQQYYTHVRQGAVRLDAASTTSRLAPLAFRNANGRHTVVVKANAGGTFAVNGLPGGTYGLYYTASTTGSPANPDLYAVSLPDQTIAAGQPITTDIPAFGVLTVFGKTAGSAAPAAANDGYATAFNTPLTIAAPGVLANDSANGSGTMTAVQPSAASSGTVTLNANGSFTYTPQTGVSGVATFTYRASNAGGNSNVATVTITVAPPNAPTASNNAYTTAFNTTLTVPVSGVLANDNANGGGAMTAVQPSAASSGTAVLNGDGSFTYAPAAGFAGAASFTYRASTSGGLSNVATVTITVAASSAPSATDDSYNTPFNTTLTVDAPGVLANDINNAGTTMTAVEPSTPSSGAVTLNADGSFTYAPPNGFTGIATFTYRASTDGQVSDRASVTITVAAAGVPAAADDDYTTVYLTTLNVAAPGVLDNDDSLGGGLMTAAMVSTTSSGALSLAANGGFSYTPQEGFAGTDAFTYRTTNTRGVGTTATVRIVVARTGETMPGSDLHVTAISGNQVTLAWAPPKSGPRPTGFRIEGGLAPGESLGVIRVGAVRSVTITLPDGSFYVRVRAEANGVVGAPSNEAVVRVGVPMPPSPPAGLLGAGAGDTLTLGWTNTYIGGAPTGMTLQVRGPVNRDVPLGLTDAFRAAGVPRGTYTFTVIATNAGGTSTPSNPVTLEFPSRCSQAPQTVANFVAYNEGGTIVTTWDPPASGAAPATYVVNVTGTHAGSIPTPGKGMRGRVPPGTYHISVVPTNPCGTGAGSPQLTVVVP